MPQIKKETAEVRQATPERNEKIAEALQLVPWERSMVIGSMQATPCHMRERLRDLNDSLADCMRERQPAQEWTLGFRSVDSRAPLQLAKTDVSKFPESTVPGSVLRDVLESARGLLAMHSADQIRTNAHKCDDER